MSTAKETYQKYCDANSVILFNQPWWLEAVTGGNWDVVLNEKNGNVTAALPFHSKKKGVFKVMINPLFTPFVSLELNYPVDMKAANRKGFEKEQIHSIIEQLPSVDYTQIKLHHELKNWLPFHWTKFTQGTRYTYILDDVSDLEGVFAGFKENIRREVRKAEKSLRIETIDDINKVADTLLSNASHPAVFKSMDAVCSSKNKRKILAAYDEQDNLHACIYLAFDDKSVYYLTGGANKSYKNSGAMSLLLWHGIQLASEQKVAFDFEGSMIESVERFFRAFGGTQTPYFEVFKSKNILLETAIKLLK